LIEMLYLSTNGVWGMLTDIFASLLLLFVMLGAVMLATGVSDTFMRLARYLGGRFRGGPAKIAVISSALMGSITGSSVTNVAMTGSVTIPMMKRLGYRPEVAGGIEATASSGGQITPPLMGAGLFLMAEMLEVNVGTIMLLAVAPALLFYFSVLSAVHFDSAREGLEPLPAEDIPRAREFLPINVWGPILIPFVLLIWMISSGKSVYLSVLYTVFCMVFVYLVLSRSFSEVKEKLSRVISSLADSAESIVSLAALIVAAGHAAGYVLRHGAEGSVRLPHVVLVAPTWRGPLPTVLGGRPGWLGAVRGAIDAPGLGHAFYRANLNDRMVRRMAQGHVYSDPDWLTEERLAGKRGVTRARGARFASVRFVTGRLDPFATGKEARAAAAAVSAERLQWIWGEEAPRRSKAEMEALAEAAGGAPVVLPRGKLALHEEFPQEVARVIAEG
jgi:hypothetical protein